jgi:nucleoid-associated protein YgaU
VKTFAAISRKVYGDEKYARALWQFNLKGMFIDPNVREDTPLPPNQKIIIAPANVLQDRFAADIRDYRPPTGSSPPLPVTASNPAAPSPAAAPAGAQLAADGTWVYRVTGNGEHLWEIAGQRLGDRQRWSEIYRLNPNVQPELAIPPGTELRMPPTARQGS